MQAPPDLHACTALMGACILCGAGRHTGGALRQWGHMRMRALLDEEAAAHPSDAPDHEEPILMQFSSLSSPGTNATWMSELRRSLCGGSGPPPRIDVVFPTARQVGEAIEGWVSYLLPLTCLLLLACSYLLALTCLRLLACSYLLALTCLHLLARLLTRSLTRSLAHSLACSLACSLARLLPRLLACSLTVLIQVGEALEGWVSY